MVRLAAGKSDAVVTVAVVLVLVIALVFSIHVLRSTDLSVNFQSAYPHPASDRVNLGDHVLERLRPRVMRFLRQDRKGEINVRRFVISGVLSGCRGHDNEVCFLIRVKKLETQEYRCIATIYEQRPSADDLPPRRRIR